MNKEFTTHRLNEDGVKKLQKAREVFNDALNALIEICPAGREFSLTRTKLEEASFFAIKSISADESNQGESTGYQAATPAPEVA